MCALSIGVWSDVCYDVSFVAHGHELRNYHAETDEISFRACDLRDEPPARTHASIVQQGEEERDFTGYKKDSPYKATGVKECSPLRFIHLFNLVWDILPDMMHIMPVIWKQHIFKMFRGMRNPKPVRARKKYTKEQNAKLMKDHDIAKDHLADWALTKVRALPLSLPVYGCICM